MTVLEIILLICGAAVFALSFILPSKKQEASDEVRAMIEEEVKKKVTEEVEGIKKHVDGVVDEAVEYAQEKTERSLERISNEKIMAVNEYSDTVLEEINKNHKEVMFLYDMLNDKHDSLVNAVSEAGRVINEAKESTLKANEAAVAAKESTLIANEATNAIKLSTKEAAETVNTFRSLSPDSIVMPEFDISQVLKYSQNHVVNPSNMQVGMTEVVHTDAATESVAKATEETAGVYNAEVNAKSGADDKALAADNKVSDKKVSDNKSSDKNNSDKKNSGEADKTTESAGNKADASQKETVNATEESAAKTAQGAEENAGGKVRTLKWATYAMQQADAAYDNNNAKQEEVPAGSLSASTEEERAVIQEAILKLHDAGKTDVEIARSLDMGVGEVSLIIGLRGKE